MGPWTIERLTGADQVDAVLAIEEASFTNPWTREMYVTELENKGLAHCVLAKDGIEPVGFCSFWRIVDELHINNLAVAPGRRRQGIGSALLRHVLREGTRTGAARATLEVRESNEAARKLYAARGFGEVARRAKYYRHPVEDALVLRLAMQR